MRNWLFATIVSLFFPITAFAAQVGFVPSGGVWFSRTDLKPGETIRVYTVVVNNEYHSLNGAVAFYDNDTVIDTVTIEALKKDEVRQLRVFWEPSVGEHRVAARFTRAEAVDDKGVKTPLVLGQADGEARLVVRQDEDRLTVIPEQVLGTKVASTSSVAAATTSVVVVSTSPTLLEQGTALLNKAQTVASTITSTAGKAGKAYTQVKTWIDTGNTWYEQGKQEAAKAGPVLDSLYTTWLALTDNNNTIRIGVIVATVVLLLWLVRRLRRRQRFYDDLR